MIQNCASCGKFTDSRFCDYDCYTDNYDDFVIEVDPDWHRQRYKALERDDWQCSVCGMTEAEARDEWVVGLHVHHIEGRAVKNQHSLDNLEVLCPRCHNRRHHGVRN